MQPGDRVRVSSSDGEGFNGYLQSYATSWRNQFGDPETISLEVVVGVPPLDLAPKRPGVAVTRNTGPSKCKKRRLPIPEPKEEESSMEKFKATVIRDPARRSVNIHIEDNDGKFLTPDDHQRHERAMGTEMPVFITMPEEIYDAILNAERLG
jgi:hypothetical protein